MQTASNRRKFRNKMLSRFWEIADVVVGVFSHTVYLYLSISWITVRETKKKSKQK